MFWLFGHEACGIWVLSPGIEPARPALEGEISTTGPPGTSRHTQTLNKKVLEYLLSDSCSPFLPVNGVWCVCVCWSNMLLKTFAVIQSWYIWPYLIITVLCVCGVWGIIVLFCFLGKRATCPLPATWFLPAWVADPENDYHFHLGLWLSAVHGWVGWSFHQPASQTEMLAFVNFKSC